MAGNIKQLTCLKCKGALSIRAQGYTKSLACQYCGAIYDIRDEKLEITNLGQDYHVEPLIPLGSRGKLHGFEWEVIGFMECIGTYDTPTNGFTWHEYLLFNPYKGFRWLTETNGHWDYFVTLHVMPVQLGNLNVTYLNDTYVFREKYRRTVNYVIGEFYWRVKIKDIGIIKEYSHKNSILSFETIQNTPHEPQTIQNIYGQSTVLHIGGFETSVEPAKVEPEENDFNQNRTNIEYVREKEELWSIGEYVTPGEIEAAFKLEKHALPHRQGIAVNQTIPGQNALPIVAQTSLVAATIILVLGTIFSGFSKPSLLFTDALNATSANLDFTYVSPSFSIDKNRLLEFSMSAPLTNNWVDMEGTLINDKTGETKDFAVSLQYYSGYDDGYWSEGKQYDTWTLSSMPKGQYHLTLKASTKNESIPVQVSLKEGIWSSANFILALILVLAPALLICVYYFFFSWARAAENDDDAENLWDYSSD